MAAALPLPVVNARPRTRGECERGPRPCPWTSCRYHLDADPAFSCVLDVADEGGVGLETVGRALGFTRENARQIEANALRRLREHRAGKLRDWDDGRGVLVASRGGHGTSRRASSVDAIERVEVAEREETDDDEVDTGPVSFFGPHDVDEDGLGAMERADAQVTAAVWRMFQKDSNGRGFDARTVGAKRISAWHQAKRGGRVLPPRTKERQVDMLRETIETAHAVLQGKLGRPPTVRELFEATDVAVTKSIENVNHAVRRYGIVCTRRRSPGESPTETPKTPAPSRTTPEQRLLDTLQVQTLTGRVKSGSAGGKAAAVQRRATAPDASVVDVLRGELARAEKRAEALRSALAVLEDVA